MFHRPKKHQHVYGYLIILSLIAAFLLGRKSEKYGYTIVSRGCSSTNENKNQGDDMISDPNISNSQ